MVKTAMESTSLTRSTLVRVLRVHDTQLIRERLKHRSARRRAEVEERRRGPSALRLIWRADNEDRRLCWLRGFRIICQSFERIQPPKA